MNDLSKDLRFAIRLFSRSPGFTALIVATLALGIGANSAIFSILDGVVLGPLDYPESDRLFRVCTRHESVEGFCVASTPDVEAWARDADLVDAIGSGRAWSFTMELATGRDTVTAGLVSSGFLRAFGVPPTLGRLVGEGDLLEGHRNVAVLSGELWRERFGADPGILDQVVRIEGEGFTVVGVLPSDFEVPDLEGVDVWLPLPFDPTDEDRRSWRGFQAIARLAPGASERQARAELNVLADQLAAEYPATNAGWTVDLESLHSRVVGSVRSTLWLFWGAVVFVLLIACVNVATLLLARSVDRRREMAIRASLGAGRRRIVRQGLAEGLLLAITGGLLGLALAYGIVELFRSLAPADFPRLDRVALDGRVLGFTVLISLLTTLLFGWLPAARASALSLRDVLSVQATSSADRRGTRMLGGLVVIEIALALMLLVGAGLMVHSFYRASTWERSLDREQLVSFWVVVPEARYPDASNVAELYRRIEDDVRGLPAVTSVGTASASPLFGGREIERFASESGGETIVARWFDVGVGYFDTLGVGLRRGRALQHGDRLGTPAVALVNETMARRLRSDGDVVGQRLLRDGHEDSLEIVGVVEDVEPLAAGATVEPEVYWPSQQAPRWATYFVVRTDSDPRQLTSPIRDALKLVEPELGLREMATFEQLVRARLVTPRFHMNLLAGFALVALILALGGTYGVLSDRVARAVPELGLRMSLGATPREITSRVLRQGLRNIALGLAVGLLGAVLLSRLLSSLLYGVSPSHGATYGVVSIALVAAGLLACYLPARRAGKIDPLTAIRGSDS